MTYFLADIAHTLHPTAIPVDAYQTPLGKKLGGLMNLAGNQYAYFSLPREPRPGAFFTLDNTPIALADIAPNTLFLFGMPDAPHRCPGRRATSGTPTFLPFVFLPDANTPAWMRALWDRADGFVSPYAFTSVGVDPLHSTLVPALGAMGNTCTQSGEPALITHDHDLAGHLRVLREALHAAAVLWTCDNYSLNIQGRTLIPHGRTPFDAKIFLPTFDVSPDWIAAANTGLSTWVTTLSDVHPTRLGGVVTGGDRAKTWYGFSGTTQARSSHDILAAFTALQTLPHASLLAPFSSLMLDTV